MPTNFLRKVYRRSFRTDSRLSVIAVELNNCPLAKARTSHSDPLLISNFATQAIDSETFAKATAPSSAPRQGADLPVVSHRNHPWPPPSMPMTAVDLLAVNVDRSVSVLISVVAERSAA